MGRPREGKKEWPNVVISAMPSSDPQHVDLEGPELRVARPAQVAAHSRHPVGQGRDEPPVALAVRPEGPLQQRGEGVTLSNKYGAEAWSPTRPPG